MENGKWKIYPPDNPFYTTNHLLSLINRKLLMISSKKPKVFLVGANNCHSIHFWQIESRWSNGSLGVCKAKTLIKSLILSFFLGKFKTLNKWGFSPRVFERYFLSYGIFFYTRSGHLSVFNIFFAINIILNGKFWKISFSRF